MKTFIRCSVFPGQFSDEYAVSCEQADGTRFSLFAPSTDVKTDEPPTRERTVDGWLKVVVWEHTENTAMVRLPRESFESGRFVTVNANQFQTPLITAEAQS